MLVYISGAITDNPTYRDDFWKAEIQLAERGYDYINPMWVSDMLPDNLSHEQYMHIDKALIDICDAVYFMDGWEKSAGAKEENEYAISTCKERMYEV